MSKKRSAKRRRRAEAQANEAPRDRTIAVNRRARRDFAVLDTLDAGLVLTGPEVKSIRNGSVSLAEGFVAVDGGEAFLHGVHIARYKPAADANHDATRSRKLLLHRDEIGALEAHVRDGGRTAIPLRLYLAGGWVKLEVGLVRGRRSYDKRERIRAREDAREIARHVG